MRISAAVLLLVLVGACSSGKNASTQSATASIAPTTGSTTEPTSGSTAAPASVGRTSPPVATRPPLKPGDYDNERAMKYTHSLTVNVGKREAGTSGDRKAAGYIAERARALGWDVELPSFPLPQGGTSTNVVASPKGFDTGEPYLIVGGHYDSLRGPGANDNASGVAVAIEIARAVTMKPAALPVRFVAFGAEERQPLPGRHHHIGSRAYVKAMTDEERRNLRAFVNVDMVGVGPSMLCGRMPVGPREGSDRCLRLARSLGIPTGERVTPDWSDNGSFLVQGMNAAWLWSGEQRCCNHTPRDTFVHVQPASVDRAGRLALAILRSY